MFEQRALSRGIQRWRDWARLIQRPQPCPPFILVGAYHTPLPGCLPGSSRSELGKKSVRQRVQGQGKHQCLVTLRLFFGTHGCTTYDLGF
jgi:hypothetical protein